jgi:hypothetical protein
VFFFAFALSSLPESAFVLRARALKPILGPMRAHSSTLGSHC